MDKDLFASQFRRDIFANKSIYIHFQGGFADFPLSIPWSNCYHQSYIADNIWGLSISSFHQAFFLFRYKESRILIRAIRVESILLQYTNDNMVFDSHDNKSALWPFLNLSGNFWTTGRQCIWALPADLPPLLPGDEDLFLCGGFLFCGFPDLLISLLSPNLYLE